MSTSDDIIDKLRSLLGLNSYEARAYLTLLKLGKARPLEIAKVSKVPHQRVYDVLKSLIAKGLVLERNGIYVALSPKEALSYVSQRILLEAKVKVDKIKELEGVLEGLASREEEEGLGIVYGLENSIARAISSLGSCNERPVFMTYKAAERLTEFWSLFKELIDALKNGALVIVPEKLDVPDGIMEVLKRKQVKIVKSNFSMMDFMIACDTVVLGLPYGHNDVVTIVIKNRVFADALKKRLEELVS